MRAWIGVCLGLAVSVVVSAAGVGGNGVAWGQAPPAGTDSPGAGGGGDPAAQKEWQSVVAMLTQAMSDLNDADRALASFVANSKLTPRGKAATTAQIAKDDAARNNLQSTIDAANLLAARPQSTAADAARFRTANLAAVTDAGNATQAAKADVQEPTYVDHTEADRAAAAQKAADAAAARQAAAAAADQARKDAEAQRKADADSKAAAADAKTRADVDSKSAIVAQALKDQGDKAKPMVVSLDSLLMKNNLTSEARNVGIRLQRRMDVNAQGRVAAQTRLDALKNKPAAQATTLIAGLTADVNALGKDLNAVNDEEKNLLSSPKTFIGGIVPSPGSASTSDAAPTPAHPGGDIVPICDFTFEPADGKPMMLGVDGGPVRPLPTHARLASGRHTLVVRRDPDSAERHELLLCGYVSTVPIEPLK
jgi:hypothetical protein